MIEDVYVEDALHAMVEEDELNGWEEAFMIGYLE